MDFTAIVESSFFGWVVIPLLIFFARIVDVSLGTVRIIYVARGLKILSPIFGFFEIMIWLLAIGQIFQNFANPVYYLAYARVRVIETTPEHHDRVMAVVQGMNHLNTLLMSLLIKECGIGRQELEHFATPLFRSKLFMVDRVTSGNTRMYAEIMAGNPHVSPLLDRYGGLFRELADLVSRGDGKTLAERMDELNQDLNVLF